VAGGEWKGGKGTTRGEGEEGKWRIGREGEVVGE